MTHSVRIVLTGGGTGGHLFPLLAVAGELKGLASKSNFKLGLYYVGPAQGPFVVDKALLTEKGIMVRGISARSGVGGLFSLALGILQSLWHLYWIMPDAIFSKGGYGALPVIIAGIFYRIPICIHESDAIPGKVNLFSSRFAVRIAVSFEKALGYFPQSKTALVGNPIRKELAPLHERQGAVEFFELDPSRKTILILGGSQGAKLLNDLVIDVLPELLKEYQVIHQCGPKNFYAVEKEVKFVFEKLLGKEMQKFYTLRGFLLLDDLRDAYAASDLVLARAGSGQIFELAFLAKPAILVPLRYAAKNHQQENAYAYAAGGGAVVLEEENLQPHILLAQAKRLLESAELRVAMSDAARQFARPEAGLEVAQELLRLSGLST